MNGGIILRNPCRSACLECLGFKVVSNVHCIAEASQNTYTRSSSLGSVAGVHIVELDCGISSNVLLIGTREVLISISNCVSFIVICIGEVNLRVLCKEVGNVSNEILDIHYGISTIVLSSCSNEDIVVVNELLLSFGKCCISLFSCYDSIAGVISNFADSSDQLLNLISLIVVVPSNSLIIVFSLLNESVILGNESLLSISECCISLFCCYELCLSLRIDDKAIADSVDERINFLCSFEVRIDVVAFNNDLGNVVCYINILRVVVETVVLAGVIYTVECVGGLETGSTVSEGVSTNDELVITRLSIVSNLEVSGEEIAGSAECSVTVLISIKSIAGSHDHGEVTLALLVKSLSHFNGRCIISCNICICDRGGSEQVLDALRNCKDIGIIDQTSLNRTNTIHTGHKSLVKSGHTSGD